MKILEPFAGYKLASGHAYFHLAYFCASFFVRVTPETDFGASVPSSQFLNAFIMMRWIHLTVFVLSFPAFYASWINNRYIG